MSTVSTSLLLPLVVLWPLLAAAVAGLLAKSDCRRQSFDGFVTVAAALPLAGLVALIAPVLSQPRVSATLPFLHGGIEFAADGVGLLFALAAALIWFCATLYATAWLREDPAPVRFQIVSLVLLSANLGVVLAGDLLTLYICFEVLGIGALLLIVHDGTEKARRAGVKYFWMTILGGISLLAGILLLHALTASAPTLVESRLSGGSPLMWWTFLLLLIGFGVKAGIMPLHIWLPDAHPAAPPPASALLSGVMIKAGAYGIFRILEMAFTGVMLSGETFDSWAAAPDMGLVVTWLGLITMLVGVVLALGQHQAKRLLAWSSVSQMGFVLTGLGAGAYLGADGAMASAGGLLHVFNHGLFKAALFLGAGAVAMQTGTADMNRLGGLWRKMPVTFACMLIAAAGITGIPLFNGFVSKSMIHHGLVEAVQHGGGMLFMAESIFLAASVGTFATLVKFIGLVFVREPETRINSVVREAPAPMLAGMILLIVPVVVFGLHPHWLLEGLIAPGLISSGLSAEPVAYFLSHYFLAAGDLGSSAVVAAAGLVAFVVGVRYGLFDVHAPAWVGVDCWYRPAGSGVVGFCRGLFDTMAGIRGRVNAVSVAMERRLISLLNRPQKAAERHEDCYFERLDQLRDRVKTNAEKLARQQTDGTPGGRDEELINAAHWMSGLLATRLLEQAMACCVRTGDCAGFDEWLSTAEKRTEDLAEASLELAVTWLDGSEITSEGLQSVLRGKLPPLPKPCYAGPQSGPREWIGELKAMVFRPGLHHWPVTEGLDRGRLAARLRSRLENTSRSLGLALGLVFALLALLLLGLV